LLRTLAEHIDLARGMAADAEARAHRASSEAERQHELEFAKAFRHVASSYEFVLVLERFVIDAHRNGRPVRFEDLPKFPSEVGMDA